MLQNARVTAFTDSELLRENQQGCKIELQNLAENLVFRKGRNLLR